MRLILGSGSPRRKEIMEQAGLSFEVIPSRKEEIITSTNPIEVVMELAKQKAEDIASFIKDGVIIGADTVVAIHGNILGKPKDDEAAADMLHRLSGNTHSVFTGVCILVKKEDSLVDKKVFYEETKVTMYPIEEDELKEYLATGESRDKAGAYGIQGRAAIFIQKINGDYYNVVGLPIARLLQELKQLKMK